VPGASTAELKDPLYPLATPMEPMDDIMEADAPAPTGATETKGLATMLLATPKGLVTVFAMGTDAIDVKGFPTTGRLEPKGFCTCADPEMTREVAMVCVTCPVPTTESNGFAVADDGRTCRTILLVPVCISGRAATELNKGSEVLLPNAEPAMAAERTSSPVTTELVIILERTNSAPVTMELLAK